ncbi:MAG: A/G-specific adenine glycosylase [Lunatimonas sp.]|uniref:A/G-specific adenine glycosylase n=1 Tax=Lunatimonas sp. TaxID=2060141 RepID=UPI00263B0619|nr:A/G-specific adenine glycosylase [Lunatimonas sp.]MCC5937533.1 A/G-specific adenine glycosylase [Lunatimonas sp.]
MNISLFTNQLLKWYPDNRRDLPWRKTKEPYFIWLSEIILQQTRVAQGLPYFEVFTQRFPTVQDLAAAPEEEVLRCWQGLGYYSRARNLHACAKEIVSQRGGRFPETYRELLQLKGVGPYTAAAIASFAFQEPVAVVDGNVYRVLARYFGIAADISSGPGKREFDRLANELIPRQTPDIYNQAIMEFGALQCTPQKPDCHSCPLVGACYAFRHEEVKELPVKLGRTKVSNRYLHYYHITCGEKTVVNRRRGNDIWKGLVDFPHEQPELDRRPDPDQSVLLEEIKSLKPIVAFLDVPPFKHLLSHQKIKADFVRVRVSVEKETELAKWAEQYGYSLVGPAKLEEMGKPKLILRYLTEQK